jgi:hypothetical protein
MDFHYTTTHMKKNLCIVMVSMLSLIVVYCVFEAWSGQTKDKIGGHHGRMIVGFTCLISVYHHLSCEFEPCP